MIKALMAVGILWSVQGYGSSQPLIDVVRWTELKDDLLVEVVLSEKFSETPQVSFVNDSIEVKLPSVEVSNDQTVKGDGEFIKSITSHRSSTSEGAFVSIKLLSNSNAFQPKSSYWSEENRFYLKIPADRSLLEVAHNPPKMESSGLIEEAAKIDRKAATKTTEEIVAKNIKERVELRDSQADLDERALREQILNEVISAPKRSDSTQQAKQSETSSQPASVPGSRHFIWTFASLFLVVALIIAAAFGLKKLSSKGNFSKFIPGASAKAIKLIESQYIGPKKSIGLVKVLDHYLVIGVSDQSINHLYTLPNTSSLKKYLSENNHVPQEDKFEENFEKEMVGFTSQSSPRSEADITRRREPRTNQQNTIDHNLMTGTRKSLRDWIS